MPATGPKEQDAIANMCKGVEAALEECSPSHVLAVLTGCFVGLVVEVVRRHEGEASALKEIKIDGGKQRDITIHASKET